MVLNEAINSPDYGFGESSVQQEALFPQLALMPLGDSYSPSTGFESSRDEGFPSGLFSVRLFDDDDSDEDDMDDEENFDDMDDDFDDDFDDDDDDDDFDDEEEDDDYEDEDEDFDYEEDVDYDSFDE